MGEFGLLTSFFGLVMESVAGRNFSRRARVPWGGRGRADWGRVPEMRRKGAVGSVGKARLHDCLHLMERKIVAVILPCGDA